MVVPLGHEGRLLSYWPSWTQSRSHSRAPSTSWPGQVTKERICVNERREPVGIPESLPCVDQELHAKAACTQTALS